MDYLETLQKVLKDNRVPNRYWDGKDYEYRYWFRDLLQRLDARFEWKNLPEQWPTNFLGMCLWGIGYVAVFKTERFGITFQPCHIGGSLDFYYQPTLACVANPKYQKNLTIGKDCEILKITPDYMGVLDIIDYYTTKLCNLSTAVNMGVANAKIPAVFSARTEAEKKTIEAAYDDVQSGKPILITKDSADADEIMPSKNLVEVWNQDFKETYIVTELLENVQTILDQFYNTIGIPKTVDKASHILNEEADFQDAQSKSRVRCLKNYLDDSFNRINKLFGTNMGVEYACEDNPSGDREILKQQESTTKFKR